MLTKDIRWEIQTLGVRLANAANEEELVRRQSSRAKSREQSQLEMKLIISGVKDLLARIEDAVPLINLAITTSGVNLTTGLPATISPSRLLQASTFLTAADAQYTSDPSNAVQVGPTYIVSIYMLFASHAYRPQGAGDVRETTWKEVIHKGHVKLRRVALDGLYNLSGSASGTSTTNADVSGNNIPSQGEAHEYAYQLLLIEDLDDDRVHTVEENEAQPGPFDNVATAGIRDLVPIHEVSKIFYADTGKILNIGSEGETNNPVLLLKRDIYAEPPRRMMAEPQTPGLYDEARDEEDGFKVPPGWDSTNGHSDEQSELDAQIRRESFIPVAEDPAHAAYVHEPWRLPLDLDPEWIAFEVYQEDPDTDDDEESMGPASSARPSSSRSASVDPLAGPLARLNLGSGKNDLESHRTSEVQQQITAPPLAAAGAVKTSLSLLEMLIRLTALQQFRQASHLTIEDELLNFFLEDASTTGAGPNADYRQRVRRDARRRVGFDPYDESPIKRRGEEYLAHPRASPRPDQGWENGSQYAYSERGTPDYVRQSVEDPIRPSSSDSMPASPSPSLRPRVTTTRSSPVPATPAHPHGPESSASPPGSLRSRQAALRSQSLRPRSPLGLGVSTKKADSTLGTSPSSEKLNKP